MVLAPANMSRFGFSPCKIFLLFSVPANMSRSVCYIPYLILRTHLFI